MSYTLRDLIDMEQFQYLQDKLNEIYSFPSAIIDNDGNILTATAWQDVCTKFHRQNKECERDCLHSDQYIQSHLHEANPAVSYRCPRGLVDNATPILIDGVHYGNFFTGQFFLEKPDLEFFRVQAQRFGFDEAAYLEAVKKVPIWSKEQLNSYLFFIKGLILIISESGMKKLKEVEARKQMQESEERHRTILETAMDGFLQVDMQGRLLDVNAAYCRMSGYSAQELRAMRISDLEAAEAAADTQAHIQKILRDGEDRFETLHRRKDGSVFDVEVSVQARSTEDGQQVAFLRDITGRKQAEKALRQSHETAQLILNAVAESVFLMDAAGIIITSNQTTAARLGQHVEDLIGANIYDFLPPEVGEKRREQVKTALREGLPIKFEDERLGSWMENNLYPIFDADERGGRVVVFGRDITERKLAEEKIQTAQMELKRLLAETERSRRALLSVVEDQKEAEQQIRSLNAELEQRVADRTAQLTAANQELEAFSYSVSHDLRAPLRAMEGFSAILLEDYADQLDESGKNTIARIQQASRRMGQLINDLLELSRVTRADFARHEVNLSALAENCAAELKAQDTKRLVEFEIAANMVVQGDKSLLKIALDNLLNNAYKFTGQRERAAIQVGELNSDGKRTYFVRDNGAGFNMDYAGKLFTPFRRLHGSHEFPGSGIGLTIVQRIINRHGGRIWADAVIDQGATFYFTLGAN
jgi:PAS domain S-box-containing protein